MIPKQLAHKFFPGLGEQFEIGLVNVGICAVEATIVADIKTARTDAQVLASASNAGAGTCFGPIVHSLGTPPTFTMLQCKTASSTFQAVYITADNSAVYFRALSWTSDVVGYRVRMLAIR